MNIIHFLENETSSNPGGFGAESKTSAQQPYNLESFGVWYDAFGLEIKIRPINDGRLRRIGGLRPGKRLLCIYEN